MLSRPQENFARLVSSVFFVVPFLGGETRGCGVPVNQTKVAALSVRPLSELRYLVYLSGGARGGSTQQEAEDRVFVSGCRGSSAPKTHKVCVNLAGGFVL